MAEVDTVMADTPASASSPSISPLQTVPLEILLRITSYLTTPELGKVRLTSRVIENSLDATFVKEFFYRKQFMLSEDSLQAFIDISKSRLGPHLRKVHFGLERYPTLNHPRVNDNECRARLFTRRANMFTLWNTGYHRDMLAEAFRNLKNLEDVVVRSFNSTRRSRDGENAMWTSYGSTTASSEIGFEIHQGSNGMTVREAREPFGSQVFSAVIAALGMAEARPQGLEYMAKGDRYLQPLAFNILPYMEASVIPVISNLEKLHLDMQLYRNPIGAEGDVQRVISLPLRNFLSHAVNIKHLRINEQPINHPKDGSFLCWLASPTASILGTNPSEPGTLPGPAFPKLEELNFGHMDIEGEWVIDVVRKFAPTLKRLVLVNMNIERELPHDHQGPEPNDNFWSEFLTLLKQVPGLNLHHIQIRYVQQRWQSIHGPKSKVSFNGEPQMSYTGPDWKYFVSDMIPRVEVIHPLTARNLSNVPMPEAGQEFEDDDFDPEENGDDAEPPAENGDGAEPPAEADMIPVPQAPSWGTTLVHLG